MQKGEIVGKGAGLKRDAFLRSQLLVGDFRLTFEVKVVPPGSGAGALFQAEGLPDGGGTREAFTVRRISHGVGVERTFPLHSPRVEKIEILRTGRVRRAKLYYLREKIGKETRVKEKR